MSIPPGNGASARARFCSVAQCVARAPSQLSSASPPLGFVAQSQNGNVLIAWQKRAEEIKPSSGGWCELGRLSHSGGRFWRVVLWRPERGEGRLLREFSEARSGGRWERFCNLVGLKIMDLLFDNVGLFFCVLWPAAVFVVFLAFFLDAIWFFGVAAAVALFPLIIALFVATAASH